LAAPSDSFVAGQWWTFFKSEWPLRYVPSGR
jgi:hypothetical protein